MKCTCVDLLRWPKAYRNSKNKKMKSESKERKKIGEKKTSVPLNNLFKRNTQHNIELKMELSLCKTYILIFYTPTLQRFPSNIFLFFI